MVRWAGCLTVAQAGVREEAGLICQAWLGCIHLPGDLGHLG